jgi:hypothetical protein
LQKFSPKRWKNQFKQICYTVAFEYKTQSRQEKSELSFFGQETLFYHTLLKFTWPFRVRSPTTHKKYKTQESNCDFYAKFSPTKISSFLLEFCILFVTSRNFGISTVGSHSAKRCLKIFRRFLF